MEATAKPTPIWQFGDLASRARVLPLHADRVRSLLQEPRIIEHPVGHRLAFLKRRDGVLRGDEPHQPGVPGA